MIDTVTAGDQPAAREEQALGHQQPTAPPLPSQGVRHQSAAKQQNLAYVDAENL